MSKVERVFQGSISMRDILADTVVSISALKQNPPAALKRGNGLPVAVTDHDRVLGYMVPAAFFEAMMERLGDMDLAESVRSRLHEVPVPVSIEDL